MKIGFDAKRLFLNASGLGNYSRNLVSALHTYYPDNTYVLFTPGLSAQGAAFSGASFQTVQPQAFHHRLLKSAWRASGIIRQINAQQLDVFHGLSNELPFTISAFKGKKIVTIHDLIFLRFPEYYKTFDRNMYSKKVKSACEKADVIISISTQTKTDLVNMMQVPENKIVVHGQSCNQVYWQQAANNSFVPDRFQLPNNYLLYVGTVEPRKNLLELLKALTSIDIPLVVVGRLKGKYGEQVMQYIRENGLQNRVFFPAGVSNHELPGLYARALCLVYPSSFEGFGLPILEAMVCGCPVITGNTSSLPEVGGPAALYIDVLQTADYVDKIGQVLQDTQLRQSLREKGYAQSQLFSYQAWAKKTYQTYATPGNF